MSAKSIVSCLLEEELVSKTLSNDLHVQSPFVMGVFSGW